MPDLSPWWMCALFAVGGAAGFVDAIAGGGGLLTLPALMLAGLPAHTALGTNKAQGVFGTTTSLARFSFSSLLDRGRALASFPAGLVGAACGVWMVTRIAPTGLRPVVMAMLAGAALFMILYRPTSAKQGTQRRAAWVAMAVAFVLAFYDGFFGPGTGTFLIVAYIWLWRDAPDAASANAKVVNMASNLGAAVCFIFRDLVMWKLALPMAAGQVLGGMAGAHLTIRKGKVLVRYAAVIVAMAMIARLVWQML